MPKRTLRAQSRRKGGDAGQEMRQATGDDLGVAAERISKVATICTSILHMHSLIDSKLRISTMVSSDR